MFHARLELGVYQSSIALLLWTPGWWAYTRIWDDIMRRQINRDDKQEAIKTSVIKRVEMPRTLR